MKKRWQISSDGGTVWRTVHPINGDKHRISQERDLETGCIGFRKKLTSDLVFQDNQRLGIDDYTYLRAFEEDPDLRCSELLVALQFQCSGTWTEFYRGKFSAGSCKWELGACVVTVKPETVDKYTCLLEKAKVKRNILQAAVVDASYVALPSLEFGTCTTLGFIPTPLGDCDEFFGPGGTPSDPPIDGWQGATTSQVAPGPSQVNFYWRERVETECVGGSPSPPPGVGWSMLQDNCATTGTAIYVRQPLISWPFDPPSAGTIVDGINTPPDTTCQWVFMGMGGIDDPFTPDNDAVPYYVCIDSATQTEINRARTLQSATEYIIEESGCDLLGTRSDFFDWNAPGDAPGYVSGENYITGTTSQTDALVILQKSDVIDPNASNPATIGEITFLEMMTALRVMFRCYWDIDDDGYVRIEHWHYWLYQQGLDLPVMYDAKVIEPLTYTHLGDEIPRIERAVFMEAQGRDFVGKDILYSGPCVNTEEVKEWSPGKITTDVSFIDTDPTSISKDGFVILAADLASGVYQTIVDVGAITGNFTSNAPLSWANLERDFWTWDRYLPTGNMNGADVAFDGYLPNIEQEQVSVTLCCELLTFDPSETVNTSLGERLDAEAIVESVQHDIPANRTRLTMRYAY